MQCLHCLQKPFLALWFRKYKGRRVNLNKSSLEPIEAWFQERQSDTTAFPNGSNNYFDKYWRIKEYLADKVYPHIGAGTSAEDGGIYTDHSIDHFNCVIRYAGKLLGIPDDYKAGGNLKVELTPYEVFIMLVSILMHDAGNIEGRQGHEKHPQKILETNFKTEIPDRFEAKPIADIAQAHGGKFRDASGKISKDTFSLLKQHATYGGKSYRSKLIASIVRFADEICEDRSRASAYHIMQDKLPEKSEIYHQYAAAITSVDVDIRSRRINIDFELSKSTATQKFGKDIGKDKPIRRFLIDEINERLEKMYCELLYCKPHMIEVAHINQIRASIVIYDITSDGCLGDSLESEVFELQEEGYPASGFSFKRSHPHWCGRALKQKITGAPKERK